jgi:hypothetical protein
MESMRLPVSVCILFCISSYAPASQDSSNLQGSKLKSPPVGVYDLLPGNTVEKPTSNISTDSCWKNPNVTGVCLRTDWGTIEPRKGVFDWSYFDDGISAAAANHKLVSLTVYSGKRTPEWVYADGAKRLQLTHERRKGEKVITMPAPWDSTFLDDWNALVKELGARYDSNPVVSYVTATGPGRGGELYFVNSAADAAMLESAGGIDRWIGAAQKIGSLYGVAFPSTPFIYATGAPLPGEDGRKALAKVVNYCEENWPDRFGIRSSGLRPASSATGFVPQSNIKIKGFQMLKAFRGARGGRRMLRGTLADTLELAIRYGGKFVEVYAADCDDPDQATVLGETNKRLQASYGQSGNR